MATKIFKVDFQYDEYCDEKFNDTVKDVMNVVAKDALHAITKVSGRAMKPRSFTDDETKKKVNVTMKKFSPMNVTLTAEAD